MGFVERPKQQSLIESNCMDNSRSEIRDTDADFASYIVITNPRILSRGDEAMLSPHLHSCYADQSSSLTS